MWSPNRATNLLGLRGGRVTHGLVWSACMDDARFFVQNAIFFILCMAICSAFLRLVLIVQGLGTRFTLNNAGGSLCPRHSHSLSFALFLSPALRLTVPQSLNWHLVATTSFPSTLCLGRELMVANTQGSLYEYKNSHQGGRQTARAPWRSCAEHLSLVGGSRVFSIVPLCQGMQGRATCR